MKKLLAVDGNSIINRAFYGVRLLSTRDGVFTNAVFGFAQIMLKMLDDVKPDAVAVAFDLKEPTFRHKMYAEYKAGRHATPDELLSQFPLVRELIDFWGFHILNAAGFEADDILGTLADVARSDDAWECVIATGDRDSLQLIGNGVSVRLAKTSGGRPESDILDEKAIFDLYGITPRQLIDVKSIMGDSSDNIPGVSGIGEKGALMLIQNFGSLDGVYENIENGLIKKGMREKLERDRDQAYFSRKLAEIVTTAPVSRDLSSYMIKKPDGAALKDFLTKLEMYKLIERMPCGGEPTLGFTPQAAPAIELCEKIDSIRAFALTKDGAAAVSDGENVAIMQLSALTGTDYITNDAKAAVKAGIDIQKIGFDVTLAAYLINPSASDYGIARLCSQYGVALPEYDGDEAVVHAAVLVKLKDALEKKIEELGMTYLLNEIELPLSGVLADMEKYGFNVDFSALESFEDELTKTINDTEQEIYSFAGRQFNINSPKQLGEVLFSEEMLNLPAPKKTKNGYSTDAETLDSLADMHPIVPLILQYRQYSKLRSTYCEGLKKAKDADGRVRSTYNQTETRTGRISSSEPNLQNIPVRTPLGREMRKFFTAKPGCVLIDADYSQIELRVLAHMSNDPEMCRAFNENSDIHTRTASQIFGVLEESVTSQMRSRAKTVNFGIIYGIGAFSLAKDLHISRKEAEEYISDYMRTFSGVREFMENAIKSASETGAAVTMFNRRRLLPELKASNYNTRAFGERVARNMPIQGTAADIIKLAMVKVCGRLKEEGMKSRLILQVHDELIVEAPDFEAIKAAQILKDEMENAVTLSVPLVADARIGNTWYECK